jgi:ribosomal protein S14
MALAENPEKNRAKGPEMKRRKTRRGKEVTLPVTLRFAGQVADMKRHAARCRICGHPRQEEIERAYLHWESPEEIAARFKLGSRHSVYRHAEALGLARMRARNLNDALYRLIERVDEVKPTAASIVAAGRLSAKINARGEWVDFDDRVYYRDLYDLMNPKEMDEYARDGTLPDWFQAAIAPAPLPRAALGSGKQNEEESGEK